MQSSHLWAWALVSVLGAAALSLPAHAGVAAGDLCKDKKAKAVGKYDLHLLKAFGANRKKQDTAKLASDVSKAQSKLTRAFTKAEFAGNGTSKECDFTGDVGDGEILATGHVDEVLQLLDDGMLPPECGNGVVEGGEECDQGNLNGETCADHGLFGEGLACGAGCVFDTSGCAATRFVDNGDGTVTDIETGLTWEQTTDPCPAGYSSSGSYTTSYPSSGTFTSVVDPSGTTWTGSATDTVLGAGPCGGTVTGTTLTGTCFGLITINGTVDCAAQTVSVTISGGLTGSGSGTTDTGTDVHDNRKTYTWSGAFSTDPDGTAFTGKLATLNGGATGVGNCVSDGLTQSGGFAGHCDWRLPTITELLTILSTPFCGGGSLCIDETVFGPNPASFYPYWSSSTVSGDPNRAWTVNFSSGDQHPDYKYYVGHVRAVRDGS